MAQTFSELKITDAIERFENIGDTEVVKQLNSILSTHPDAATETLENISPSLFNPAWKIKEHAYGFLDKESTIGNKIPLKNATSMTADSSLKNERLNIRIGNIYIERYPGIFGGDHEILFDFSAKHSPTATEDEQVKFSQKYTLRNGQSSAQQGIMALSGLKVPKNGIDFGLKTIYLENQSEQKLLRFLNNDTFKAGLQLLGTANPVIKQVAGYATGISEYLIDEKKNKVVQGITIGFDFSENTEVASLRLGTYVAIQVKRDELRWDEWYYDTNSSIIKNKETGERLPYNHISFILSKYEE